MIYLGGKPIRAIYRGETPVASVYLGDRQIWQSWVTAAAGAVIVLQSDALLRAADGVTYTVEAVSGVLSCVMAEAMQGAEGGNAAVWAIPVTAKPYMRHIAPTQSASPPAPLAELMPVLLPTETGKAAAIGGSEQAAAIMPGHGNEATANTCGAVVQRSQLIAGQGNEAAANHGGTGVQRSPLIAGQGRDTAVNHCGPGIQKNAPVAGAGGILRDAEGVILPQRAAIIAGSDAVLLHRETAGGVFESKTLVGTGGAASQTRTGGGFYRADARNADGRLKGEKAVTAGTYDAGGNLADGRLYAAWAAAGAMPEIMPMYARTDSITARAPVSSPRPESEPGYAGTLPASCDYQTPPAAGKLLGSYAEARQSEAAGGVAPACAAAEAVGAADAPGAALSAVGVMCAACMMTRVYINPAETTFDAALVSEMDILVLVEIDQMAMYN